MKSNSVTTLLPSPPSLFELISYLKVNTLLLIGRSMGHVSNTLLVSFFRALQEVAGVLVS